MDDVKNSPTLVHSLILNDKKKQSQTFKTQL